MRFLVQAAFWLVALGWAIAAQAAPKVVATISPVHSLTAGVMEGVGTPKLLLKPGTSPHSYALRPSDARALANADLIIWVGRDLERFLVKPLATLAANARQVELIEAPGLLTLKYRTGEAWESHEDVEPGHHRDHGGVDPHIWLDPQKAESMVEAIAAALIHVDPDHAETYEINAESLHTRLAALDRDLAQMLAPVAKRPFMVFHDSFQYLERRYGLTALGSVTVSPERQPGARRVSELRKRLGAVPAACLFTEPQFSPALAHLLASESDVRLASLDPLGTQTMPGPGAYFAMMRKLAAGLHDCLASLP